MPDALPRKPPSVRTIARVMSSWRERLSGADSKLVAVVGEAVPALRDASALLERFQNMLRSKQKTVLDTWLADAAASPLAAFAKGIGADRDAVAAAITEPRSNGQTEAQITKLPKRQMYGRASLDLRKRVVTALLPPARCMCWVGSR